MAEARPAPARVRVTGVVKKSEPNTQALSDMGVRVL